MFTALMLHLLNLVLTVFTESLNNIKVSNPKIYQKPSSNSLSRKSSSVRNHRGRQYANEDDIEAKQKYFGSTKVQEGNLSGYVYKEANPIARNYLSNNTSVNKAINYYSKASKMFPRSKTNSRKRGAVAFRGKDSRNFIANNESAQLRGNNSSIKRTPVSYGSNVNRNKSNNRSHLKERIKTIEYNDNSFNTIAARSNTVQKRRRFNNHDQVVTNLVKPYSNIMPSSNTRSNITIDRSGSVGYGKLNITSGGPASITQITDTNKTNSRKIIMPINEYEDDSIVTINSTSFGKNSNLNTIIGIKHNNDNDLTLNSYKTKTSNKEITQKPKFNKVSKKESLRSKSNKRVIQDNLEKVYMQSPSKIIM